MFGKIFKIAYFKEACHFFKIKREITYVNQDQMKFVAYYTKLNEFMG